MWVDLTPHSFSLSLTMLRLEEIGAAASKEYSLEKAMEKMRTEWEETEFTFIEYRDTVSSLCEKSALSNLISPFNPQRGRGGEGSGTMFLYLHKN